MYIKWRLTWRFAFGETGREYGNIHVIQGRSWCKESLYNYIIRRKGACWRADSDRYIYPFISIIFDGQGKKFKMGWKILPRRWISISKKLPVSSFSAITSFHIYLLPPLKLFALLSPLNISSIFFYSYSMNQFPFSIIFDEVKDMTLSRFSPAWNENIGSVLKDLP